MKTNEDENGNTGRTQRRTGRSLGSIRSETVKTRELERLMILLNKVREEVEEVDEDLVWCIDSLKIHVELELDGTTRRGGLVVNR